MIEWAVSRLTRLRKKYDFGQRDLQSCMILDVEHFHVTTHYKTPAMTMLQYSRIFGESMKENVKKLSNWSAHYFTDHRSWYLLPEKTVSLHDIP